MKVQEAHKNNFINIVNKGYLLCVTDSMGKTLLKPTNIVDSVIIVVENNRYSDVWAYDPNRTGQRSKYKHLNQYVTSIQSS
ncbi:hypothetical protein Kuja_1020 [Vibrio phage vB_VchM_Kuja]|uniref:Uncharacterized protein n=1 Tax=Vibrio phage vB_VchM_Kuja TaxID=2686437 RepID=A0A6B9J965_9CAUD|nr:hypothetical protein HWC83_gp134 [Vibrio phage vB_VchM_Kuja]QGZ16093.1 hypothetical protein Kuja_1020 [Vibrio phage vB_VchM_Kuja]